MNPFIVFYVIIMRFLEKKSKNVAYPYLISFFFPLVFLSLDINFAYKLVYLKYYDANIIVRNIFFAISIASLFGGCTYFIYNNNYDKFYKKYSAVKISTFQKILFISFFVFSFWVFIIV